MQCPNCKHWNEAGANFCEECGFELTEDDRQSKPVSVKPGSDAVKSTAQMPATPAPQPPHPPETVNDITSATPFTGARLVLTSTGSIFKLGDSATIGREDPRLDIDLEGYPEGKYVSGNHARIVKMNNRFYVEDLGSSNHTYVNNRRIAAGQLEPLTNGDVLRFGKLELKFSES